MVKNKKEEKNFLEYIEGELEELNITSYGSEDKKLEVIKTGALSIDISTGIGGIPKGRFTEIYGAEGSGKTTLTLSIANQAIKSGYKVLYIDAENSLGDDRINQLIENYSSGMFIKMQPHIMEEALFIAEKAIKFGDFGLIILDSIGGLAPRKVIEDKLDDDNVALLARRLTVFVQRNSYWIRKNNVAFIGVNQVRDKIGSYMGGYETPGGHTWKHECGLRIFLSKMSDITQGDTITGVLIKFVIRKNKLAPPFRTFTFPLLFEKGVDSIRDIVEFSSMLGALNKKGPYYTFEENTLGSGIVKTVEYLNNNKETLDKIVDMCYNRIPMIVEEKGLEDEQKN